MAFPLTQLRLASLALGKAAQPSPSRGEGKEEGVINPFPSRERVVSDSEPGEGAEY